MGISADKFGIVYRFWHKIQPGYCGNEQLIKVREAPSDQIIKPESCEERKKFLLERKETLIERKKTLADQKSLNNRRKTNITPQDQDYFVKKFTR